MITALLQEVSGASATDIMLPELPFAHHTSSRNHLIQAVCPDEAQNTLHQYDVVLDDPILTAAYDGTVVKARCKWDSILEKLSILKEVDSMVASHKVCSKDECISFTNFQVAKGCV
jgi:hypothetical protein